MATETLPTTQPQIPAPAGRSVGLRRTPIVIAAVVAVLLGLSGGYWIYQHNEDMARRVAPAVQAGGVQVGGLTVTEAQTAIQQHFTGLADSQILVRLDGQSWTFTAHDLGIGLDTAATALAAKQAGREVSDAANIAPDIPLVLTHDR